MNRPTASTITDDQLDYLIDIKERALRALDRVNALAESWEGDLTSLTRSEASEIFELMARLSGWEQTPAEAEERPVLSLVPPTAPTA